MGLSMLSNGSEILSAPQCHAGDRKQNVAVPSQVCDLIVSVGRLSGPK